MKYKNFLLIFTALIAVNKSRDVAGDHCSNLAPKDPSQGDIDWVISSYTHESIRDVDTFTTVFTYEGKLGYDDTKKEGSGAPYIDVTKDDKAKTLTFETNNEFKNLDLKTDKQPTEELTLTVTITLTCNDDTTTALRFLAPVKDTNNNFPTFNQASYEYTVPMPLPPHIDLTGFGQSIVATDIDFSNTDVTFTLNPPDKFVLSTIAKGKDYQAVLKVNEFFRLTEDTTYELTATDNKVPYKQSTVKIVFKVDKDNTLPDIPRFDEPFYKYQYSVVDGKPVISGPTITVTTTDPQKTAIKLQDNDYCKATYDPNTNEVKVESTETPIKTTEHVLIYTLEVTLDSNPEDSSQTIILIDIPDDNVITVPSFSEPYYTATYSTDTNPHTISLDGGQTIKVTNDAGNVNVTLGGEHANNFDITKSNEQWELSVVTDLSDDILKKGGSIVLTLDAAVTDSTTIDHGFATLIINLPEIIQLEVPEFSQTYYEGTYTVNADGNDTVTINNGSISLTNLQKDETVEVTFDPSSDNFDLQKVTDHWEVVVLKDLDDNTLAAGKEIVLKVKATVTGDGAESVDPGTCTLIISLPEKDTAEIPIFSQPHYTVTYQVNEDGSGKVEVTNGPIEITNAGDKIVDVTFVEQTDNFDIAPDGDNIFIFSLNKSLSLDQIKDGNDIVLTLKASLTVNDSPLIGYATIIVTLPDVVIPQFSQPIYTGTYIASKTAKSSITLDNGPIEIILPTENSVIVTLSPSLEYFSIDKDKENNNQWVISVVKNVTNEILESGQEYVFTLQATIEKDTFNSVGLSSLVIQVPKVDSPKFVKPQYSGKYIDGDLPTVEIEQIKVDSSDIIPTTFVLDGKYSDHFEFEYDITPQFKVKTKLESDIIDTYQEIVMTLQVSYQDSTVKPESTVIVLNLPYVETLPTLQFEKPSYTFSYIVDGETPIIDGENIKLRNGNDNVAISISGSNHDNFEMKRNTDGTYCLKIIKPLDPDVLDSDADELLIATASLEGFSSGFTAILLNLPKKVLPAAPQFAKSVFVANYIIANDGSTDTVEMVDKIIVSSKNGDKITVELQPTSDNFEIIPDTTKDTYKIHVKSNLDESTLIKQVDVVLKLQASITTSSNVGESALVIKLPKKVSPAIFSNKYYTAQYIRNKGGKDTVKLTEDITLNGDYVKETTVKLDAGDYNKYFSLSTTAPYTITVTNNLEDTVLDGQSEVIVTLIGSLDGSSLTTSAPIIITLPKKPDPPKFSNNLYSASYDPDTTKVTLAEGISVSPDDATVNIAEDSPYKDNLALSYNTEKKVYTVNVTNAFNNETVDKEKEIYVVLVASVDRAITNDEATLVIKMPEKTVNIVPKFSELYYFATYQNKTGVDDLLMSESITITSDHSSDTTVIVKTYNTNFQAERDGSSWKLKVKSDLEDTILNQETQIIVELEADLQGSLQPGSATVIVALPKQDKYAAPKLTKTYYYAKYYYDEKNNPSIKMTDSIAVVESTHSKLVEVALSGENHEHFGLDHVSGQNLWTLKIADPLKPDFIKVNTELNLILTATLENSVSDGTATLIIELPDKIPVSFDKPWYYVNYKVNDEGTDTITSDNPIKISDSKADVTLEGDYSSNFDIDCSSSTCILSVNQDLSNETLSKETETILILKAQKADVETITEVTIIVSLPKKALRAAPEFTSTYYTAEYNVNQGNHSVKITSDNIAIKDDSTKQVKVTVADIDYTEYFSLNSVNDYWELELISKLSEDILNNKIQLVLKLLGTLESSSGDGSATLLIALPGWEKSAIHFSSPYYEGEYSVNEDSGDTVDLKDLIKVEMKGAVINTTGQYANNFEVECDNECQLVVKNDLSQDVLNTESEILVLLEASKLYIHDKGQATVIIKLPQPKNKPEFSQSVYTADYTGDSVSVDNQITIKNVDIKNTDVVLDGDNSECFDLVKQEDHWELHLKTPLPSEVVNAQSAILLSLVSHIGSVTLNAALVIKLPKTAVNASLGFSDNVYMASYDGTNLAIEKEITVNGTSAAEANIILSGDYVKYFKFSYTNNKVSITIDKPLPEDVLKQEVAISVDIGATKGTEYVISTLVVKLPKQTDNSGGNSEDDGSDDKSGLIAAVAVLAVLLVGALVGSAVFYYIKFKRNGSNYKSMDDNLGPSEHFKRNSNPGTKNKFEHPTRRPTGVIKYPLSDESPGESVTEDDEIPEKRKSVQFDVVNIDELQIESEKPDENLDFETSENNIDDQNQEEDNISYL